jgi:hypothetical protein
VTRDVTLKVGYAPYRPDFMAPGDQRRFCAYARARRIEFERADPSRSYDVIVVAATADIVTWSSRPPGRELIVFDIVDSYLAEHAVGKDLLRGLGKYVLGDLSRPVLSYRRAIERMCSRADAVICGTEEQRQSISAFCRNVHVILDEHDDLVKEIKSDYRVGETLNVFWEGLPYNLSEFRDLTGVLRRLAAERPVALHLMTLLKFGRWSGRVHKVDTKELVENLFSPAYVYEWNEQLLSRVATGCDLALIPLNVANPFARGKPANKLLLLWRMGLPVLASPTPAYCRAMRTAGLDMTCAGRADWFDKLRRYASDEDARRDAGERGRELAGAEYSDERVFERWDRVFESVLAQRALVPAVAPRTHSNSASNPSANATAGS